MAMEQLMQMLQNMPPEEQQALMTQLQQQGQSQGGMGMQAPGLPPMEQPPMEQPPMEQQGMPGPGQDPMAILQQNPEMMEMLNSLPPEEREAEMMRLFKDYQGLEGIISDQQAKAEILRGTKGPQGVHTGAGGYVAGNPIGHAAAGIQQFMGNQQASEAMQAKKDLSEDRTGGVMSMAANLLRKNR